MCLLYSSIITDFKISSHSSLANCLLVLRMILLLCIVLIIVTILLSFHYSVFKFPFNFFHFYSLVLVVVTFYCRVFFCTLIYLFAFLTFCLLKQLRMLQNPFHENQGRKLGLGST